MSDEKSDQEKQSLHEWLPTVILKFLVFAAFAFVLYEATVGLGETTWAASRVGSSSRGWGVVAPAGH